MSKLKLITDALDKIDTVQRYGLVSKMIGLVIEADGPEAQVGELCIISSNLSHKGVMAEVVGFNAGKTLLMPISSVEGIYPGSTVYATGETLNVQVGPELLGRVVDGLGNALDRGQAISAGTAYALNASPPDPMSRPRITQPLSLGVKALDSLLTMGKGQRLGIFAGSGVGKSTLLGMIARNTTAQVNVIALVGERGREVREFIERDLGEEGLARSVVVVATSDQPALMRCKAAFTATAIAEYFRDQGADVLLMMDSVTRFAMSQREIGLAIGEPPATRGYPPSAFAILPRLLERAGTSEHGSITALYSVLVEGDDHNEPIADAVRGILDGHIVLTRELAAKNHYPSISILDSVSRVMGDVVTPEHQALAKQIRQVLATYEGARDLVEIGAYAKGSNSKIDYAIDKIELCEEFLQQGVFDKFSLKQTLAAMEQIFA
ncbi:MAG: flagellar protein export ATPase FliI [Peptococcaceae bacterium]|nr:flagellar protein export ATPase FliI [Peptococcaceae bacterium]